MNINGIQGSGALAATPALEPKSARSQSSIPPAPDAAAARTHISGPGQLFSRLQQLADQDPAQFKDVAQKIADQLTALAQDSTGRASDLAQKLADRFGQAAQTGDLSAFQAGDARRAMGRHPHHDHEHHSGHLGGNGPLRSVLESALDLVHQALQSPSSLGDTSGTSTESSATESPATPSLPSNSEA